MPIEFLTREPERFTQGDTVRWERALADFPPSSGWVLKYAFATRSARHLVEASTSSPAGAHRVEIASADSATWGAGDYRWQAWVENGTERKMLDAGRLTVAVALDSEAAEHGADLRSHAEIMVEAIRATMHGVATKSHSEYAIQTSAGSRQLKYASTAELREALSFYEAELRREQDAERIAKGLGSRGTIHVRLL